MKCLITATLATIIVTSPVATAGPLNKDWVAADAQWVIHVDVAALLDSTIGRFILEHGEALDLDLDDLDEFKRETGLDPRTDLKSVTVYGTGDEPGEDGVIVAVTNDRVDEAIQKLLDNDDVLIRKREMNGRTIYVIGRGDDRHYLAIERAGRNRRIVVLSDERHILSSALKVIGDDAPSLSMGRSQIPGDDPQEGSLAFLAVGDIEAFGDGNPASHILRMSDGFTADIGEIDGVLLALATVSADSPKIAEDITDIIRGLVALGRIMAAQQPELGPIRELADSLTVRTNDSRITLKIRYDARELMEQITALIDDDDDDEWDEDWDDDDDADDHQRRKRKRSRDS
ncbi:MAG: hypothetical protein E2O40_07060 [Planctomycetota bacterium]|nr:MAG: hypothetical protein E2O40_07060 [Planctomycetota bacterium]